MHLHEMKLQVPSNADPMLRDDGLDFRNRMEKTASQFIRFITQSNVKKARREKEKERKS